eukprot:gene43014-53376_t
MDDHTVREFGRQRMESVWNVVEVDTSVGPANFRDLVEIHQAAVMNETQNTSSDLQPASVTSPLQLISKQPRNEPSASERDNEDEEERKEIT